MLSKPNATSQTTPSANRTPPASAPAGNHAAAASKANSSTAAKDLKESTLDHLRNLQRP